MIIYMQYINIRKKLLLYNNFLLEIFRSKVSKAICDYYLIHAHAKQTLNIFRQQTL